MLFDTHAHYSGEAGPFSEWIDRARNAGVSRVLLCATGWESACLYRQCAEGSPSVYFAAGIHPEDAPHETDHPVSEYGAFLSHERCIAVGEIGLDYYYDGTPRKMQLDLMQAQLSLALEWKKPVIIHCRDKQDSFLAYEDSYSLLRPYAERGGKFLLHAFAGTPDWLEKYLALGAFFGVGGMVTFKKAENIREIVVRMPLNRFFLETDSPYLAPVPFRGKENHPAYVPVIADYLAQFLNIPRQEIESVTTANASQFFGLKDDILP